ncbi:predicted protein [Scheffersomyces stipitis CBS 6054]|uniref:SH3 domain-containing protein n=1 Tax=Scheffersomyces stipitis (strain ATCC 58785 / CBS 6054 / NBRC 10063 / NRRL Y-11545) TaxID=322104 RepID=A3LNM9_PICST|nr:predicted protein [Scheffersomyces stipitis CBS 6054]ABN64888.2 predicted protein [Scheffersomyces stipitis CBS 6054]
MSVPQPPFKVKTKVSWAGEEDGDLGFLENEIIEVYSIVDESWWSGKLRRNRAEGIFPKDYVEVIPELNKSVSSHSIGTPKAQTPVQTPIQTPVKEADYGKFKHSRASGTPTGMYNSYNGSKSVSPKRYHHVNVDADGSFEVEDAVNCTYDGIYDSSNGMSSSNRSSPKKIRSANKLVSSTQHPRYRNSHNGYQQQQHEDFDREREMENFRTLQQQQNYHIKKSPSHNMKSSVQTQQQEFRQSSYSPENSNSIYGKHQGKSNSRSGSQQNLSQSAVQGHPPQVKSQSYVDIPYRNQQNNTVESFVSEGSPSRQARRARYDADAVNEYEIISQKRAQLELELSQLKQLERSTQKKRVHNPHLQHKSGQVSRGSNDDSLVNSLESSYISEDLLSSKKNYSSREDLGKKLAKFESVDDEDDDYFNDNESSPPPPPPKHTTPIKAIEAIRDNDSPLRKSGNKVPFDADDFRFSGSNRLHQGQVSEEDVYRVSQLQQDDLKNSIKSLQSDVLNLSELSATSAGSFMRHKYERDIQQQEMKLHSLSINEEEEKRSPKQNGKDVMDSVFQEKKSRHPNIFKMLLSKKSDNEINVIERKLQKDEEIDWTTFKMDLNQPEEWSEKRAR